MLRDPHAEAGDVRDADLVPGLGRSPGEEMATYCIILVWRIPLSEEPGGLLAIESHSVRDDWGDSAHIHTPANTADFTGRIIWPDFVSFQNHFGVCDYDNYLNIFIKKFKTL